jgi:predicted GNAT family N-acyltransferase
MNINQIIMHESAESDIKTLVKQLEMQYTPKSLLVHEDRHGHIVISSIIVNNDARKSGVGTAIMTALCNYADTNNKKITLTPATRDSHQGTTSTARLIKFYRRFGFVENKGRRKDFTISDYMYRDPQ